ncbi:MAG TPA: glycine cleavage system protein GcvH [Thermoplasmata archaeon]|nr:glycine cleavage system protein GcvH [Thermoplasmata archaeon]
MSGDAIPEDRRYTKSHEWVRVENGEVVMGITDHAQSELTDIVFVDLPAVGKTVKAGESVLVLESVKTVADVYAPTDGTVSAVNADLKSHPELINKAPYAGGWLVRIRPAGAFDPSTLLDAAGYRSTLTA